MSYKYGESEKFRANMFLFAGYAFCTPLGMIIVNLALEWKIKSLIGSFLGLLLFLFGLYLIFKSYDIILEKEQI